MSTSLSIPEGIVAARLEAIDACIAEAEARIATGKACQYHAAYMAGVDDLLVSLRAVRGRVARGEGYHSKSELMAAESDECACGWKKGSEACVAHLGHVRHP